MKKMLWFVLEWGEIGFFCFCVVFIFVLVVGGYLFWVFLLGCRFGGEGSVEEEGVRVDVCWMGGVGFWCVGRRGFWSFEVIFFFKSFGFGVIFLGLGECFCFLLG